MLYITPFPLALRCCASMPRCDAVTAAKQSDPPGIAPRRPALLQQPNTTKLRKAKLPYE